jgi:spore coat protein A, manganese oxidase
MQKIQSKGDTGLMMAAKDPKMRSIGLRILQWGIIILTVLCANHVQGDAIINGLMDPDRQPKFVEVVPEALSPTFKIRQDAKACSSTSAVCNNNNKPLFIGVYRINHETGLVNAQGKRLVTPIFAYGQSAATASWPGPTMEVQSNVPLAVQWSNELVGVTQFPFSSLKNDQTVLDTTLHWAYSLMGYEQYTIGQNGIPVVVHLHGSHSGPDLDGNPEHFFTPNYAIKGPEWAFTTYQYENDQPAAMLWYHDHALGITRLNVYAGLAGMYFIRDDVDTGTRTNTLGLPSGEYEKAYVIQDRMFKANGQLFYPAYAGEPGYDDFIVGEGASWDTTKPTAFAEFFGDFMVVNGKIWPRQKVQSRRYRIHLLNGSDSRFLAVSFVAVKAGATSTEGGQIVPYTLVGADQGLLNAPIPNLKRSLIEPGARIDIVIDFGRYFGKRIIVKNEGGDSPFSGELPGEQIYNDTDKIMAFDVARRRKWFQPSCGPPQWLWKRPNNGGRAARVRRVGLFEGRDAFGRLLPMQGGEREENIVETFTWIDPTTETPKLGTTEEWEIYNFSDDAVRAARERIVFWRKRVALSHFDFMPRF